ncbi:hypothetical protein ABZV31_37505 [Streptomyces sp. NPDC005202]|uniref:hypothetical protein n=1 Tax=Streptomyces sp. NPDC005202 TaxID=3157021 RepID=UPI0033AB5ADA
MKTTTIATRHGVTFPAGRAADHAAVPTGVRIGRGLLVLALLPASLYLVPRVANLVVTPDRLDQAVVHANNYNPQLAQVVELEKGTLAALDSLDQVDASLAQVRGTVAKVDRGLATLVDQVRGDVQGILDSSNAEVRKMLASIGALEARLRAIGGPVGRAADAVAAARASMLQILAEGRSTGGDVHRARTSADDSADHVSGSE